MDWLHFSIVPTDNEMHVSEKKSPLQGKEFYNGLRKQKGGRVYLSKRFPESLVSIRELSLKLWQAKKNQWLV